MEKFYQYTLQYINNHSLLKSVLVFINTYFPMIMFFSYPLFVFYLFITHNLAFYMSLYKPFLAFSIVTILRKIINRPRPYEVYHFTSLMSHKNGESFPSRHSVSAMIIALVSFSVSPIIGWIYLLIAYCICIGRILIGVHHISDVVVAMMIAYVVYLFL